MSGYWPRVRGAKPVDYPSYDDGTMFTPSSSTYTNRHYKPTDFPKADCSTDEPLREMDDPYKKDRQKCLLCAHPEIEVDYKNPRLLSQFISSFSGRTYDHHITGLSNHLPVFSLDVYSFNSDIAQNFNIIFTHKTKKINL